MLQVIPSFFAKYSKNIFFFCKDKRTKNIVRKNYCLAHIDAKISFIPNCGYHIFLHGNIEELLQKLNPFYFTYEQVDCLYTLFKYRFSEIFLVKSGQVFENGQRAVRFSQKKRGVDRMRSIAKQRILKEKYRKRSTSSFQKTKSTQIS